MIRTFESRSGEGRSGEGAMTVGELAAFLARARDLGADDTAHVWVFIGAPGGRWVPCVQVRVTEGLPDAAPPAEVPGPHPYVESGGTCAVCGEHFKDHGAGAAPYTAQAIWHADLASAREVHPHGPAEEVSRDTRPGAAVGGNTPSAHRQPDTSARR